MRRCAAIFALLLLPGASLAALFVTPEPTFSRFALHVGGRPRGVTAADFNADGHMDFAAAHYDSPTDLIIYFGSGDGGLRVAGELTLPHGGFGLTNADLDHDGRPDIITTSADSNVLNIITWRDQTGTFEVAAQNVTGADPREVVAGDFNRDGAIDLAVALYDCNCVEIWRGAGNLTFPSTTRVTTGAGAHGLASADFNRDGILDLVVTNGGASGAVVLFGDGTGAFPNKTGIATGSGPRNVVTGDFNEDGWLDFATVNTSGRSVTLAYGVRAAPGSFTSTFTSRKLHFTAFFSPRDIDALDTNGDGKLDLVVADHHSGNMWPILGDGEGHFGPNEGVNMQIHGSFSGRGARTIAAGDFDEDGRVDLLVGNQTDGTVTMFFNTTRFRGRP